MNKKIIRLTESDLRNIVKESVSKVINEIGENRITEDTDHQSRFDSIINTCEEETEKLINAIYESNGIFSSGNDEAMVMRLRRLIKILNKAANSKFETVKNTGLAYNLFNMLSMYYSTVREATYNLESLDFQGLNKYVSQLEHYIIGILD